MTLMCVNSLTKRKLEEFEAKKYFLKFRHFVNWLWSLKKTVSGLSPRKRMSLRLKADLRRCSRENGVKTTEEKILSRVNLKYL